MTENEIAEYFLRHQVRLTGYLRSLVRDGHMAEDLFQDVCLQAIESRERLNDEEHLQRWVYRTGKHRAIDLIRKRSDRELFLGAELMEKLEALEIEQTSNYFVSKSSQDRLPALRLCLNQLTPRSRRVIALKYGEELPGSEIAAVLNRKVDSIYKALSRIYDTLRRCVEAQNSPATEEKPTV